MTRSLRAVHDLLAAGSTNQLILGGAAPSGRGAADERWIDDDDLDAEVEDAISRAQATGREIDMLAYVLPMVTPSGVQVPVQIEVVWGGIGRMSHAYVVVVGHYQHVYPDGRRARPR